MRMDFDPREAFLRELLGHVERALIPGCSYGEPDSPSQPDMPPTGVTLFELNTMTEDERRLLAMLAKDAEGCTDALLTARGFKLDTLISVVSAEFATVPTKCFYNIATRATAKPERKFPPASPPRLGLSGTAEAPGGLWRYLRLRALRPIYPLVTIPPLPSAQYQSGLAYKEPRRLRLAGAL
jgi:hypothetical protein